jgi:hypothetical protein
MAVRNLLFDELGFVLERDRGSDSVFVQRCLDQYPPETIHYCRDMRVQHLEIDRVQAYFRKCVIYGSSCEMDKGRLRGRSCGNRCAGCCGCFP